jgi:hypothetical protein
LSSCLANFVNLNPKSCQAEFISASLLSQNLLLNKTKNSKQKTTIKNHKVTQVLVRRTPNLVKLNHKFRQEEPQIFSNCPSSLVKLSHKFCQAEFISASLLMPELKDFFIKTFPSTAL